MAPLKDNSNLATYGGIVGLVAGGLLALAALITLIGPWNVGIAPGRHSIGTAGLAMLLGIAGALLAWRVMRARPHAVLTAAVVFTVLALFLLLALFNGAAILAIVLFTLHTAAAALLWVHFARHAPNLVTHH